MLIASTYKGLLVQSTGFTGSHFIKWADGISKGVTTYLRSHPSCIVSIGDIGTPGTGIGNGFLLKSTCQPTILTTLLLTNFQAVGFNGAFITKLAIGLSKATCNYLASANTLTTHAGVGVGTTIGGFFNLNPSLMTASILSASSFVSTDWTKISQAISISLVTFFVSNVKFSIVIAGPPAPGIASGTGFGKIL